MPITFQSIDDPLGIRGAGSILGQALAQRNLEQLQNRRQLEKEQRALDLSKSRGGVLSDTMKKISDPNVPYLDKVGAISEYISKTGDREGGTPILNELIKRNEKEQSAISTLESLRQAGVPGLPEKHSPGTPASTYTTIANVNKPVFEQTSDKLEAERSAQVAQDVTKAYKNATSTTNRLNQMESAVDSKNLPTPLLVATMEKIGLPLGVLGNPLAENYDKNVNENIKGVSDVFRGAIRVAEIEPYMRTIPTLLNSDKGKKLIIKNQRLEHEAKIAEYKAYREILKENNNKKPANLEEQILDRTEGIRQELADQMRKNIEEIASIVPTQRLYDAKGQAYDIPTNLVPQAIEQHKLFYKAGR